MVKAVFYLPQTGCRWRMLPRGFPPRNTVFGYFCTWIAAGVWAHLHDVLYRRIRDFEGGEKPDRRDHRQGHASKSARMRVK